MGLFAKDGPDPQLTQLAKNIENLTKEVASLSGQRDALTETNALTGQINDLKVAKQSLELELDKVKEDHAREEREMEHKLGLHRKQVEAESELAKKAATAERAQAVKEAKLEVQEGNLDAERKRFNEEIDFRTKRFEEEAATLRDLTGQILARLPNVTASFTQHVGTPVADQKELGSGA